MNESTVKSNRFLEELLIPLIKKWGHAEVRRHLDMLDRPDINRTKSDLPRHSGRLTALEYVQRRLQISPDRRDAVLELAARFDQKRFLPTVSDIRRFLGVRDPDVKTIVRREAAIPKVMKALQHLSDEQLQQILRDENYAGPARLGPLSEAIRDSGAMRFAKS